jgi:sigma-B regulation protein RsbU (phosphoserine phosphatase)
VSGKGIPASMFMVRTITLAQLLARDIAEPERILAQLNDELATDNPAGMFVTLLCASFEPESHRLTLANAGHCRPVLLPADGPPRWAVKNLGTALGFETGVEFERTDWTLKPDDALILYSDGVSEAFNPRDECYGLDRLLSDAGGCCGLSAPAITRRLLQQVHAFASGVPQSDDIAILTVKVNSSLLAFDHARRRREPTRASRSLELYATPDEVMRSVEALQEFAAAQRVPDKARFSLALALEECGSNIVNHALQRDARRTLHVAFERTDEAFVIELRDDGPPFDPTCAEVAKSRAEDDEAHGGWGLELVRRNVDDIRYRREADRNVLRLTKRLVPAAGDR